MLPGQNMPTVEQSTPGMQLHTILFVIVSLPVLQQPSGTSHRDKGPGPEDQQGGRTVEVDSNHPSPAGAN